MQSTFIKRVLPFLLTLIVGIGVSLALGRVFHGKYRAFRFHGAKFHERSAHCPNLRWQEKMVIVKSVPDSELPPMFDKETSEGQATIRMEGFFDQYGRVSLLKFPQYKVYSDGELSESQLRSRRLEQELMDFAAKQARQIVFKPSSNPQWLNVETTFGKKAPGRGCSSVTVKISGQNKMLWEGETLAEGRRCGANFSSF